MKKTIHHKKILYLITQSQYGGAQKYISDLMKNLDEKKYIAELAIGKKEKSLQTEWLKNLKEKGFKIWYLKHVVRELRPWHDFLSAFELYKLFLKSKPDIIHLNSSKIGSTGAVIGWLYKKLHNKHLKIIYTVHGFVFNEPLPLFLKSFYLWSEKISAKFKDKLICVSEADKIIGLNNHIGNNKKLITIHNGIDLEKIKFLEKKEAQHFLQEKYNLPESKQIIGTIANLYSTKGLEYLIRSAKNIITKYPNLIFVIIGEGSLRKKLETKIKKLDLENKFFLIGEIKNSTKLLKAFDIFCLSSVKEGLPYTLIEALSAGLPIVATRVGGIMEIVEPDINGLIIPPKNSAEITQAIEKILNNQKLQEKFHKNNLEKIKQFTLKKMVQKTEEIYEK